MPGTSGYFSAPCVITPDIAAEQLRSFAGSALEITASSFELDTLVNTDPSKIRIDQFEDSLASRIDEQALRVYGITVRQAGLELAYLAKAKHLLPPSTA